MALQFILGNSGSGKTTYLFKKIVREAAQNPFKNYLVIVPEQFTIRTQQMLVGLSPENVIMNIDVLSFKRLAYRVFDELGIKDIEILEETGKNLVLRKIAAEERDNLGVMRSNMGRIGYISEVKSILSEFVQYNIYPDKLEEYINSKDISEALKAKLSDVLVMYKGFEKFMKDKYITAEEILNVLSRVASKSALFKNCELIFDEFTGFTPIQNTLLKTLLPLSDMTYVAHTIDYREDFYKSTGMQDLFDMTKRSIKSLMKIADDTNVPVLDPIVMDISKQNRFAASKELYFMEQNLFRRKQSLFDGENSDISITCCRSPRDEMVFVARKINELVRKGDYRYKDIAIVSGDVEIYSNYAREVFSKYEIPYYIDTTKEILFHPFIEFIRAALEVVAHDFSIDSVFRFLRCGFCDIDAKDIDLLENYVLALGLRGKKNWSKRFLRTPKTPMEVELLELDAIREKIYGILEPIVIVFSDKNSTVRDQIIALYQMIDSLSLESKLWELEEKYLKAGYQVKSKEYKQIYLTVMKLFEKYIYILGDEKMSVKDFTDILDAGFDAAEVATLPPGYDSVTLGDIERTRLTGIKVMFFAGVNEGIVPKVVSSGGIISQYEREMLKEMDIELAPGAREQSFIQKFYLYLNMTKPSEKLFVSYFRLDKEGKATQKSYLISTITRMFPKMSINNIEDISIILDTSTEAAAKEYLVSAEPDENWFALAKMFDDNDFLDARFMYYEGNPISMTVARAVFGDKLQGSVSRLETFARCQYAHFLSYGLRLRQREESGFESVDIGNIYHDALYRFSMKLDETEGLSWRNIDDSTRDQLAENSLREAIEQYPSLIAYGTGRDDYLLGRIKNIFLKTVWALAFQVKKGKFDPEKYEFSFKVADSDDFSIYGKIDRIDTYKEDGKTYIKIIDYKSGNADFDIIKLYHGLSLQLAMYLDAAASDSNIPGGMLYYHIDDPVLKANDDGEVGDEETAMLEALRPTGLINSDDNILFAYDEGVQGKSLVAPFKLKKDNTPDSYSSVASTDDFNIIRQYTRNKIAELSQDIMDGNIKVNPLSKPVDSCLYCDFKDVCSIKAKIPGLEARSVEKLDKKDVLERMATRNAVEKARKEKSHGSEMD